MESRPVIWGAAICLLSAAGCVRAAPAPGKFGGTWTMKFGARTFLVLALTDKGNTVTGTLARPEHFQTNYTGFRFTQISRTSVQEAILSASEEDGRLHFATASSKDGKERSEYDLVLTQTQNRAALKLVDAPFDPWILTKNPPGIVASVSTDWEASRSYSPEDGMPSNAEMQRVFDADQKERQDFTRLSRDQQAALAVKDTERRRRTLQLLADGQLHTGEDFKQASFVFQHGDTPDDYLLAHTLAMVAVSKGTGDALWIGAATLDRYLQAVGKPQIYGTQFKPPNKGATQEPYDRALISDALRRQLDVPPLALQVEQFNNFIAGSNKAVAK
jgi:hypothetical protein